jgi:5-bromo-4-chloroindolyl phosphate hydrolysis protein
MTKIWTDTYDLKSKKWVAKRKGYNEKRLSKERRRMIEKRMEEAEQNKAKLVESFTGEGEYQEEASKSS